MVGVDLGSEFVVAPQHFIDVVQHEFRQFLTAVIAGRVPQLSNRVAESGRQRVIGKFHEIAVVCQFESP